MNYDELRKMSNRGWNTWNSASMTSHVLLPYGFCINLAFKDFADNMVIRDPKVGDSGLRPGMRSWDGTYTCLEFSSIGNHFTVESTADEDNQYILITPEIKGVRAPAVSVEACILWGKEGCVKKKNGRLSAEFEDGKTISLFTTGKPDAFVYSGALSPNITVTLDGPVAVSTVPCTVTEVRRKLDEAKADLLAEEETFGVNKTAYQAMRSCLAWDTIYEPEHDRVCSPVSRSWNETWGGYVLFCWDTYFAALMSGEGGRDLAYLNTFAITNEMTESGFVPNFGTTDNIKSRDRSQPPVGSMVVKLLWNRFHDDWFVKEIFPALYRWNTWFHEHRTLPDGTLCWGSEKFDPLAGRFFEREQIYDLQGAKYESGLDNSPMYDDASFDEKTSLMQLSDVGLTGLYIKDCRCLLELADIAGHPECKAELQKRLDDTERAMMTLWNRETGIFENRNTVTGEFSHRISPTNLYSLHCSLVTKEQKESMSARYLCDPAELGGTYMLPSISRSDSAFPDQNYWRGRIWAPMNFLVYEALCDAGMEYEKGLLAESSRLVLLKEWDAHGHVHENYSGYDGWGCPNPNSNNFYHWGGLLGYVAIEYERSKHTEQ